MESGSARQLIVNAEVWSSGKEILSMARKVQERCMTLGTSLPHSMVEKHAASNSSNDVEQQFWVGDIQASETHAQDWSVEQDAEFHMPP